MKLSIPFYKDYAEAQPKNDFLRLGGSGWKLFQIFCCIFAILCCPV